MATEAARLLVTKTGFVSRQSPEVGCCIAVEPVVVVAAGIAVVALVAAVVRYIAVVAAAAFHLGPQ